MGTDQVAQHDLNKGYFERPWAGLSSASKFFTFPGGTCPILFSHLPLRFHLLHQDRSTVPSARDASRTCDLSLLLWIVFRLSETPHTVILFTDIRVLSNGLHLPSIIHHLLKIDDYNVPKCSKRKQPRKVRQVSLLMQQVYLEHLLRHHPRH